MVVVMVIVAYLECILVIVVHWWESAVLCGASMHVCCAPYCLPVSIRNR